MYTKKIMDSMHKCKECLYPMDEYRVLAKAISDLVRKFLESKEDKVAILIQQRNPNAEIIMKKLEDDLKNILERIVRLATIILKIISKNF